MSQATTGGRSRPSRPPRSTPCMRELTQAVGGASAGAVVAEEPLAHAVEIVEQHGARGEQMRVVVAMALALLVSDSAAYSAIATCASAITCEARLRR